MTAKFVSQNSWLMRYATGDVTLPHYHRVYSLFPAARTLQRAPCPTVALRDSEQLSWFARRSRITNWRCLLIRSVSITPRIPSAIHFICDRCAKQRDRTYWRWRKRCIYGW